MPETDTSTDASAPTAAAYARVLPEILAVPATDLITINIDVMTAVTTVLGCLPEIRTLRGEIEAQWRTFDFDRFDKLGDYAFALSHAHALYRAAWAPKGALGETAEKLTILRDRLFVSASALASFGLINGERIKTCKTELGYRPIASDVLTIAAVLTEAWPAVRGSTPFKLEDVVQAEKMAAGFLEAIGLKEQAPALLSEAVTIRQQAFTLFVTAYEDARRAVQYLRAKFDDAGTIAPSLYLGRATRRRTPDAPDQPPAPLPVPPAPTPEIVSSSIPVNNRSGLPITSPTSL